MLGFFILCLAVVMGLAGWLGVQRYKAAQDQELPSAQGINHVASPTINGVPQWVEIRGQNKENPVIVFIHGGPWSPMSPWAHLYQRLWESAFTVVQWDQRGVGKSQFDPQTQAPVMQGKTLQNYVDDAAAVIDYVKRQTGKRKVIVVGHSWGAIIGLELAQQRPDLLHAYVGTGQVLSFRKTETAVYQKSMAVARAQENKDALAALGRIAPYPESLDAATSDAAKVDIFMTARGWASRLLPGGRDITWTYLTAPFISPHYSLTEAFAVLRGPSTAEIVQSPLFDMLTKVDFLAKPVTIAVPVFFLEGREDHQAESAIVAGHLNQISAPRKEIHWLEKSGHFAMVQEPERFRDLLIRHVRPVALEAATESANGH